MNEKTGMSGGRLMTKKEFRATVPTLKGNALSRAFDNYIDTEGRDGAAEFSRHIVGGNLRLTSCKRWNSGKWQSSFVEAGSLDVAPAVTVASVATDLKSLSKADREKLMAEIASMSASEVDAEITSAITVNV